MKMKNIQRLIKMQINIIDVNRKRSNQIEEG